MSLNGYDIKPGANLRRSNLTLDNLRGANLRGAILIESALIGSDLRGADLIDTNLTGAILTGAILTGANLTGANLTGATLPEASSLKFCLALNSNIEGAITSVVQLLNLIEDSTSNEEESNIYKSHLKWIEDNIEQLIRNGHITDNDKAKIDDRRNKIDLAPLSQCSEYTKINTYQVGSNKGLTDAVRSVCAERVFDPNVRGQEK